MSVFDRVYSLNRNDLELMHVSHDVFNTYGRIIEGIDFSCLDNFMNNKTAIPAEGNSYVASVEDMERNRQLLALLENRFYGEMPAQIGYCNGKNSMLNGLEYHKSSEINYAITDMVLILGNVWDIKNNKIDASSLSAFFIPMGTAIELYATTLHFAPCKVDEVGFKCVVVLPKHTNCPLENTMTTKTDEDKILFMKNKWLLVHKDAEKLVDKGAVVGIVGKNIRIKFKG